MSLTETAGERRVSPSIVKSPIIKRMSWGSVSAGVVMAVVTQITLGLLGVAIGASTIDPLQEQYPLSGLGLGAGIWLGISTLISLFVGGWVAGRLAGMPKRSGGALHGLITWGLTTIAGFFLLSTAVGSMVSGTAGLIGGGLGAAGQGIVAVAPNLVSQAKDTLQNVDWSDIQQEAAVLLRQTEKPRLQPDNLQARGDQALNQISNTAEVAGQNPQQAEMELEDLLTRLSNSAEDVTNAADRDAAINILMARTDMTRNQAASTVDRWTKTLIQAKQYAAQFSQQAEQKVREIGDATASGVSKGAFLGFIILLLGGLAAGFGGYIAPVTDLVDYRRS